MLVNRKKSFFAYIKHTEKKMKKAYFVIGLILIACTVKAQTFQRKVPQPAFFMPKSALSTQKQEQLPAIESMNYQGKRAPSVKPQTNSAQSESKAKENPFSQPQVSVIKQTTHPKTEKNKTSEKAEAKVVEPNLPISAALQNKAENQSAKTKSSSENPEDYQLIFASIMRQHKADLMNISKGLKVENEALTATIEAFKPKVHRISETID